MRVSVLNGCVPDNMENYCNDFWPLIYDQSNHGRHEEELAFYVSELASPPGPVLEIACGTGMILLSLIKDGMDTYGFDISAEMLAALYAKATRQCISDIHQRVTRQNMVDFHYEHSFQAICIPARSFLHLATQDEQIACLKTIHKHLRDDGRVLLNFFTPSLSALLRHIDPTPELVHRGTYEHPETREKITLSFRQVNDLSEQVQRITWRFAFAGGVYETPMRMRWIYKNEFELLARLSGFRVLALYSGFDRSPYRGEGEMVWVLGKESTQPITPADPKSARKFWVI